MTNIDCGSSDAVGKGTRDMFIVYRKRISNARLLKGASRDRQVVHLIRAASVDSRFPADIKIAFIKRILGNVSLVPVWPEDDNG